MRFDVLCSVAHNLADSLGSGASLPFNFWDNHVYNDALQTPGGELEIDLLNGKILSGNSSKALQLVVPHSPRVLANLCEAQGVNADAFRKLLARFVATDRGRQFTVTVEDQSGRSRSTCYDGSSGKNLQSGLQSGK